MFILTVCQVGAEPALKREIEREHPELRFAYSRPGFVTFKATGPGTLGPEFALKSVFARAYGLSLGKCRADAVQVIEKARALGGGKFRLHVWERDRHSPGETPPAEEALAGDRLRAMERGIRESTGADELFYHEPAARAGDLVLDVVGVDEDEWWIAYHSHDARRHSPHPGGRPPLSLPEASPSRAYLKIAEAVERDELPLKSGDMAVEIGSAPGGASFFLLENGVSVVGIDPAAMAPNVLGYAKGPARFSHIQEPVGTVLRERLPETVHWLLLDMNIAPGLAIYSVDRLAHRMRAGLLGLLLVLKLNDWKMADEIPSFLEHIRVMGMVRILAKQLANNRQEFFVSALTARGMARVTEAENTGPKPRRKLILPNSPRG